MAESSLALTISDLKKEVAVFVGWSPTEADWSTRQADRITTCVNSGLRDIYFPASGYDWSFLHPVYDISTITSTWEYVMPDDFAGAEGAMTFSDSSTIYGCEIPFVNEGMIREKRHYSNASTGRPELAAIRPLKGTTPSRGQRFEMILWPTPDAVYALKLPYYVIPDALSTSFPYHYGGAMHAETFLESCLAQAEIKILGRAGIHTQKFQERLAASMLQDRKMKPHIMGPYRATSSGIKRNRWRDESSVTVNGEVMELS